MVQIWMPCRASNSRPKLLFHCFQSASCIIMRKAACVIAIGGVAVAVSAVGAVPGSIHGADCPRCRHCRHVMLCLHAREGLGRMDVGHCVRSARSHQQRPRPFGCNGGERARRRQLRSKLCGQLRLASCLQAFRDSLAGSQRLQSSGTSATCYCACKYLQLTV